MSKSTIYAARLQHAKRVLFMSPDGLTDADLAVMLGVERSTACRIRQALNATLVSAGHYTCSPTKDDLAFADAAHWREKNGL
jgi:hypothetical protein